MKYFSSIGHDLLINPVNISLVFVGVASVFILNSVIPNTRKIPLTIFVVSLVVAAGLITYKVIDAKQE